MLKSFNFNSKILILILISSHVKGPLLERLLLLILMGLIQFQWTLEFSTQYLAAFELFIECFLSAQRKLWCCSLYFESFIGFLLWSKKSNYWCPGYKGAKLRLPVIQKKKSKKSDCFLGNMKHLTFWNLKMQVICLSFLVLMALTWSQSLKAFVSRYNK